MSDRSLLSASEAIRERGIGVVRFNFLYRARKSSRPDPMPKLIACVEAVTARVRAELDPQLLIVGGRSMGGRAASMWLADAASDTGGTSRAETTSDVARASRTRSGDALLLLAYPLHPPGQPEKLRAAHLPAIQVPVLCINGTRDTFCDRALMERVLTTVGSNWRMHWIDDADHGFHVPKRSGRTDRDVANEVAAEAAQWIAGLAVGQR
jgi:predicted alpha/beta-hydrolase family hydrolase